MASLLLKNVCKEFPNHLSKKQRDANAPTVVKSVNDFNLEINDGEFIVFVGPSGCGKSTTLRMIAGLETITSGEIYIDGVLVNNISPKDRNISMVFQNYALYPHMSVYDNIRFPLNYTRFVDPVSARKKEIQIATETIDNARKLLEKPDEKKNKYTEEELQAIIDNNLAFIEEAKLDLAEAEKTLQELLPSKEETSIYKRLLKNKPAGYEEDETYKKVRKYYELTRKKYSKADKDEIIRRVARLVDVEEYLGRKPKALSGGQRQRVALARALVRSPKVFLLDEPLSNLDAKLRTQMRSEIVSLHNKIKTTFIYVTHDQVEAMTMGDRIVVMKLGVIQQVDTPTNLFDFPANKFVAGFIGTPQMNFFDVEIRKSEDSLEIRFKDGQTAKYPIKSLRKIDPSYLGDEFKKVYLGVRSEDISLSKNGIKAQVETVEILGNEMHLFLTSGISDSQFITRVYDRVEKHAGDEICIDFNARKIHLFAKDEFEKSIMDNK